MIAISSKKRLKASLASALVIGALATTPAFAQATFNTVASYPTTGPSGQTITSPAGNTQTLSDFSTAITTAFGAGTGGDINFDNVTTATSYTANSVTASFGPAQGSTLTISSAIPAATGGNYSTGLDAANATSGSTYFGYSNVPAAPYNFDFNFGQSLANVGIMVINRGGTRNLTFTVTLDNGVVVTPNAAPIATSNGGPTFFEYAPTAGRSISGIHFATADGYTRFDDLGFIAAPPAAAPEPSQFAGLGLGVLGLGVLALKARKRTILGG